MLDAGRREGLDVSAAFIHDLGTVRRHDVDVAAHAITNAESKVLVTVDALRKRDFEPKPKVSKCRMCDVRLICNAARLR